MRYVIEGTLTDIESEDSGYALVAHTQFDDVQVLGDDDDRFFVRLHSFQNGESLTNSTERAPASHPIMESIRGKRIRITIESLEEEKA